MKKHLSIFLILLAISFYGCSKTELIELPITTSSEKSLQYYHKAHDYYSTTDFPEGWMMLDSALALDPNFAMANLWRWHPDPNIRMQYRNKAYSLINKVSKPEKYILKSNQFEDIGNMDSALFYIQKLVNENQGSYQAYNELGILYGTRNELKLSEEAFKKAIELNPENYQAYTYLNGLHIAYGFYNILPEEDRNIKKGMEYSERLIKMKPDRAHGYHFKANCYRQIGDFEKAIPLYEKAVEMSKGTTSEAAEMYVSGHNIMFAGDFDAARERYQEALEVVIEFQTEKAIRQFITISYLFQRNFEGALDNLYTMKETFEAKTNLEESYLLWELREIERLKFICYAHNQMEKEAERSLNESIALNKKITLIRKDESSEKAHKVFVVYNKAWNDILFGNYQSAKTRLDDLKTLAGSFQNPTAFDGYYGLSGMLELMERNTEDSEEMFKKGDIRNVYFNYFKALALKANGKQEKAKEIFTSISSENFSYLELSLVKGLAHAQLKNI